MSDNKRKGDITKKEVNTNKSIYTTNKYKYVGLVVFILCLLLQRIFIDKKPVSIKQETPMLKNTLKFRSIINHFIPAEQGEGVGAVVRRSVGSYQQRRFSPFLMLDDFKVTSPSGFPDHPHHGQETITYVLGGMIAHEDFTGSKGVLKPGDLQFMTAGKGIMHSEMPVEMENGEGAHGLQFWVDLPENLRNCEPRYRNLRRKETPIAKPNKHLQVRVISGKSYGVESVKDLAYTPIHFYHFSTTKAGTEFVQEFPKDFNVFLYVMKGSVTIDDKIFRENSAVFFDTHGDAVTGQFASDDAEFALAGGLILEQPLIQHGPFVESNREKLMQAFDDFQHYTNGFERGENWRSGIADGIKEVEARKLLD